MKDIGSEDFSELVGEDLSGVTFVRDYLQLQFNPPPSLNVYTPVAVRCCSEVAKIGDEAFADLLIAQINKVVRAIDLRAEEALDIRPATHHRGVQAYPRAVSCAPSRTVASMSALPNKPLQPTRATAAFSQSGTRGLWPARLNAERWADR